MSLRIQALYRECGVGVFFAKKIVKAMFRVGKVIFRHRDPGASKPIGADGYQKRIYCFATIFQISNALNKSSSPGFTPIF